MVDQISGWIDGWVDEWSYDWLAEWMDWWMYGQSDGWLNGCMDRWVGELVDASGQDESVQPFFFQMYRWLDGQMYG